MTRRMTSATPWRSPATDKMTRHLLASGLIAGVAAGLVAALLQFLFVIPPLLEGELYETGARVHFATDGTTESDRGAPGLGGDVMRHGLTVAFNLVTYAGYGLILAGLMVIARIQGVEPGARVGLIWGLCGFLAVQLAPAIGLPPELPGTPAGEVGPRQAWWFATIILTAAGLGLIAFARGALPFVGIALIAAPQLWGAPHLDAYFGVAPPELSAHFATLSLGAAAAGWALLGCLTGWLLARGTP